MSSSVIALRESSTLAPIYVYQHHAGCPIQDVAFLINAADERWWDGPYANRMAIQALAERVSKEYDAKLGLGIGVSMVSADHWLEATIVWQNKEVWLEAESLHIIIPFDRFLVVATQFEGREVTPKNVITLKELGYL